MSMFGRETCTFPHMMRETDFGSVMTRPVVGIIGNAHLINDQYPAYACGEMNTAAVSHVSGALPMMIPADPRYLSVEELMASCDGFLLTGGRPNVHPEEYGEEATAAHGCFDRARDAIVLPLVRACVERGSHSSPSAAGFRK